MSKLCLWNWKKMLAYKCPKVGIIMPKFIYEINPRTNKHFEDDWPPFSHLRWFWAIRMPIFGIWMKNFANWNGKKRHFKCHKIDIINPKICYKLTPGHLGWDSPTSTTTFFSFSRGLNCKRSRLQQR